MEKLKPCPFCGCEATVKSKKYVYLGVMYFAGCENKGCKVCSKTIMFQSKNDAIAAWNRRADDGKDDK